MQTISRLNRQAKNKKTFILDFINPKEVISGYFREYYGGEIYLPEAEEMDIKVLENKKNKIFEYFIITQKDVDDLYDIEQDEKNRSGDITYIIAKIAEQFGKKTKNIQKEFLGELKKFSNLYYYISAVFNAWDKEYEKLATVFAVVYKVLYEPEQIAKINPEELVELVSYSTKLVAKEMAIELDVEDKHYSGISTEVSVVDRKYSDLDKIIESINQRYAKAEEELQGIVDSLSQDAALQENVKKSAKSAYEEKVSEKLSSKLTEKILEAAFTENDIEKANFYTALSNDQMATLQICNLVIQNIKKLLENYG